MKTDFEIYGDGKPIVFLHAFPLNNEMWRGNIGVLLERGFQAILPNLFFEDKSETALEKTASGIADLVDSLNIKSAIFIGLSLGGYVAFNLYHLRPELFAGLILCDTNAAADSVEKRASRFDVIEKLETTGNQILVDSMLPNLVSDFTKENNVEIYKELEKMIIKSDANENIRALKAMAFRKDHQNILEKIDVPTQIIFGADDKVTGIEIAHQMHNQIPRSKLSIIHNAGHYSNLEQPAIFNQIVLNFVQTVEY